MPPAFKPPYLVPAPNAEKKDGETLAMRHFKFQEKLATKPDDIDNMWGMFLHGYNISKDKPFLGTREVVNGVAGQYVWETYAKVHGRVENFAKGLSSLGLQRQKALGVYSVNKAEWTISELASYRQAFIIVALYDTLGPEAIEHIINQVDMEYIVASADKLNNLIKLKERLPTIKHIVIMENSVKAAEKQAAADVGITVHTFKEVEALGKNITEEQYTPPKPDETATICYTSGTTGVPKGAVLTHSQCVAPIYGAYMAGVVKSFGSVSASDVYISYLPMAHVFERVAQGLHVFVGASVGFYQGDTNKLLDDIAVLRPTVFCSVPRLFNKIYDKVLAGVKAKGGLSQFLFNKAFNAKKANLNKTVHHKLWDRLVFAQIRSKLGGRIRFILSGSAPVSPDVMDFMRICFSARVFEGYGQTENYCAGCLTIQDDNTPGVVGAAFPCSEIKLIDVPDMNYHSTDKPYPRGEICIRSAGNMKEYYKEPEKTAETLDEDGWIHTGDIGLFDEAFRVKIIDRRKNIFKLSQGEYIAPEKIEGVYQKHELIAQAYVYGDSLQPSIVGVLVPDPDTFPAWAKRQPQFASLSSTELYTSSAVNKEVLKILTAYGKENDLKGFEQIRAVHLTPNEFTIDNGLLTPTFKLKREVVQQLYAEEIKSMYATLSQGRAFN